MTTLLYEWAGCFNKPGVRATVVLAPSIWRVTRVTTLVHGTRVRCDRRARGGSERPEAPAVLNQSVHATPRTSKARLARHAAGGRPAARRSSAKTRSAGVTFEQYDIPGIRGKATSMPSATTKPPGSRTRTAPSSTSATSPRCRPRLPDQDLYRMRDEACVQRGAGKGAVPAGRADALIRETCGLVADWHACPEATKSCGLRAGVPVSVPVIDLRDTRPPRRTRVPTSRVGPVSDRGRCGSMLPRAGAGELGPGQRTPAIARTPPSRPLPSSPAMSPVSLAGE
jgi:hypothetical protein